MKNSPPSHMISSPKEIIPTKAHQNSHHKPIAVNVSDSELKRAVYSLLLREMKDKATMLQAKVECNGDNEKAETRYFQLRYAQIVESGKINKIREKILEIKRKKALQQEQVREKKREANIVVKDREAGLEWFAGPDKDINWVKASFWAETLDVAGKKWRMPTIKELKGLYERPTDPEAIDAIKLVNSITKYTSKCVWSGQTNGGIRAWYFHLQTGEDHSCDIEVSGGLRALAVRSSDRG